MFGHYLTSALRAFARARFATASSVLVLSIGLVCFVTAYAVVDYWQMSERQFENADRTYVITREITPNNGDPSVGAFPHTPLHLARYLVADYPQVEAVARALPDVDVGATAGDRNVRINRLTADPDFLKIFDLPFIVGDPETALQPGGVVLTERGAERLFGSEDPMGKTVTFANLADTTVTGIISPIENPSHLGDSPSAPMRFDVLASWSVFEEIVTARAPDYFSRPENWASGRFVTYALLSEDVAQAGGTFDTELGQFAARHIPAEQLVAGEIEFGALPVNDLLTSTLDTVLFGANRAYLSISALLLALGGLILAVACINYANIAAAMGTSRAREIAVRKVVGARKRHVIAQFLFEVVVLTLVALILSLLLLVLIVPLLRAAGGIDLGVSVFSGLRFWGVLIALLGAVTIAAGTYPASILSAVRPVDVLRARRSHRGSRTVSTLLIGLQVAVASFLVVVVVVVYAQNSELRRTGLSAANDPLLMIDNPGRLTGVDVDMLRNELSQFSQVNGVTSVAQRPWDLNSWLLSISRSIEASAERRAVYYNLIGEDFFDVFDMEFLAGRNFDRERGDDITSGGQLSSDQTANVVVDRAFTEGLGFDSPELAIDELIYEMSSEPPSPLRIVGVVESQPLHIVGLGATSNVYAFDLDMENEVVRLSRADVAGGVASINELWNRLSPNMSLSSYFVDDLFETSYENFGRAHYTFAALALFALLISGMGLAAMAVHVGSDRIHEIGVRKTVGAKTSQIIVMLLRDFGKPIIFANIVAWPFAYMASRAYLNVFLHQIELTPWPFVAGLLATLLVSWLAVGGLVLRVSSVRPADVLRAE